jgi:hypothetical protein
MAETIKAIWSAPAVFARLGEGAVNTAGADQIAFMRWKLLPHTQ